MEKEQVSEIRLRAPPMYKNQQEAPSTLDASKDGKEHEPGPVQCDSREQ